ncbi:MAG: hypothetical protein IPI02_21750 [Sterolibacteriaceae bacterium]|nr:hypothetical protein [Sterolibacteriaceae bacterium]
MAVSVKVSVGSLMASSTIGARTSTLVAPGAKVALAAPAALQVAPLSVDTCSAVP